MQQQGSITTQNTRKVIESKTNHHVQSSKEKIQIPEKIEEKEKQIENEESSSGIKETTTTTTNIEDSNREQGKKKLNS